MECMEFENKVKKIADIMGYKWTFTENRNLVHIKSLVPGEEFYEDISIHAVDGRLRIIGWYPDANDGARLTTKRAKITVVDSKSPEQIVRDMERRLLPGYRKTLAEIIPEIKVWNAAEQRQISYIEALAKVCGITQVKKDRRGVKTGFYLGGDRARGDVKAYGDIITIELGGITFEKAHAMLTVLME